MGNKYVTVNDVMTSPRTITSDTTLIEAARQLIDEGIGSLVIIEDDDPIGIITETDVVALVAQGEGIGSIRVSEIMSTPLVTIEPSERLDTAATTMKDYDIKKLPVVDGDDLIGMVTTTDISQYLPKYHPQSENWIG